MSGRLQDQVALVTGAGRGMGRATALRLAQEGAKVVAVDLAGAEEAAAELTRAGHAAVGVSGSVADRATWESAVGAAADAFGGLHVLANVAGVTLPQRDRPDALATLAMDDFEWLLDVNLRGPLLGMQVALPLLLAQPAAAIVNVISGAALVGVPNHTGYSASKGGLQSMTRQIAVEYGPQGLRANSVAPGAIDTPMNASTPEPIRAEIAAGTPLRRMGTSEDCAALIAFLASGDASFITGTTVVIDGGFTAQ